LFPRENVEEMLQQTFFLSFLFWGRNPVWVTLDPRHSPGTLHENAFLRHLWMRFSAFSHYWKGRMLSQTTKRFVLIKTPPPFHQRFPIEIREHHVTNRHSKNPMVLSKKGMPLLALEGPKKKRGVRKSRKAWFFIFFLGLTLQQQFCTKKAILNQKNWMSRTFIWLFLPTNPST